MPQNAITLEEAQAWAERWNNDLNALKGIKAFKIPGQNIKALMNQSGTVDIRAYIAVKDNNEPTVVVVGVDANGNDMIDPARGFHIYDFAEPCPNCCNNRPSHINRH